MSFWTFLLLIFRPYRAVRMNYLPSEILMRKPYSRYKRHFLRNKRKGYVYMDVMCHCPSNAYDRAEKRQTLSHE